MSNDYDRDDDRRDRDDDDRPRRRDYDDAPPKKKGGSKVLVILLVVFGVLGLVCVGSCGAFMWWGMQLAQGAQKSAEGVLTKVASGDMAVAYNSMSSTYKTTHSQEQFEKAMKDAKLDQFVSVDWTGSQSNNDTITLTGPATLKGGGTVNVSAKLKMLPDFKTFEVEDISAK